MLDTEGPVAFASQNSRGEPGKVHLYIYIYIYNKCYNVIVRA